VKTKKYLAVGAVLLLTGITLLSELASARVVITWQYGSGVARAWALVNASNNWGGRDYMCGVIGSGCQQWDWMSVYDMFHTAGDVPAPAKAINYPYVAAAEAGITYPILPQPTMVIDED
jgi:hypothetical protein